MREILFRGKAEESGLWLYGDLRQWTDDRKGIYSYKIHRTRGVIPETVGQYTGLTDKNGTRIFDGDIVKDSYVRDDYCSAGVKMDGKGEDDG